MAMPMEINCAYGRKEKAQNPTDRTDPVPDKVSRGGAFHSTGLQSCFEPRPVQSRFTASAKPLAIGFAPASHGVCTGFGSDNPRRQR